MHWTGVQTGTQTLTVDDLNAWADLSDPPYQTRVLPNTDPQSEPRPGIALSIRHLLGQLNPPIAPGSVTFTEAPSRGGLSTLTTNDLTDPSDPSFPFQNGLMPAIYIVGNNDAIGYIRPLRNADDTNGKDFWQTNSQGALELTVHTTGKLLTPSIHASRTTTTTGAADAFSASFDAPPATALTYSWTFGDGGTATTRSATASHRYKTAGSYLVFVSVVGADGSIGQSKPVRVTVGKPPKPKPKPTTSPGTGSSPHASNPSTGPNHGQGGRAGTAPTTKPEGPVGATHAPAHATAPPAPAASGPPPAHLLPTTAAGGLDPLVHGVVISNADLVTATAPSRAHQATAPAARQARVRHLSLMFAWVLVGLLLLGLGAARESPLVGQRLRRFRAAP